MADDDEIDVLGDFSFNSCFAQNNQGIPSCSNREDTVHPQWLLDSTATNWYDKQTKKFKEGSPKKLYGNSSLDKHSRDVHSAWSPDERQILVKEMAKYGRNVRKISQTLKTKTEAQIQALIEAEFGVHLEVPTFGLDKSEDIKDVPAVAQEEIVTDITDIQNVLDLVRTGAPTITLPKKPFRKKTTNLKALKPEILSHNEAKMIAINPAEVLYEDEIILGSTESVGTDIVSKNILKQVKLKAAKKIGNHRRKVSRNYDKGKRNKSKEFVKSPVGRQRKDSSLSEDSVKSPKMQIVLGSGQALPVSEGEQVIKIEKKKDSDSESDIDVDVDSDNDNPINVTPKKEPPTDSEEAPIAVPLSKFEPMPRRHKKLNLDGGGGYTIMHTDAGDLFAVGAEPRRERAPRKQPVHLLLCRRYNAQKPAPFEVYLHVSALLLMDAHAHTSRAEVMGLLGGDTAPLGPGSLVCGAGRVTVTAYRAAAAAAGTTHCDMEPVSQAAAAARLAELGAPACGWHHSHPVFGAAPSEQDVRQQRALQRALERGRAPFLGFITSQHWATGRRASHYRCIRVEEDDVEDIPTGYQLSVKLVPDLKINMLPTFLEELRGVMFDVKQDEFSIDMANDIYPEAGITYLAKFISSASHHLQSAGYEPDDPLVEQLIKDISDVFKR